MAREIIAYDQLIGLDSVAEPENMSEKWLIAAQDCYVDFRRQVNKSLGLSTVLAGHAVHAVNHVGDEDAVYFTPNAGGAGLDARSRTGAYRANAFTGTPSISFTQFARKMVCSVAGQTALTYDAGVFTPQPVIPMGHSNATILKRLAVAGIPDKETELHVSKLDLFDFGTGNAATDGAVFDIKNQLTNKDAIQGVGTVEGDKIALFCKNETVLYKADTDITKWELVRDFRIPLGVFGQSTIKAVGTDLFFGSRTGVHSLRRALSGLTLETMTLSAPIKTLYQDLMAQVPLGSEPSAVWAADLGQYHIYVPRGNGVFDRLTFTYEPGIGRGGHRSWSYTPDVKQAGGSYFNSELLVASADAALGLATPNPAGGAVNMLMKTPILWQGSPQKRKEYKRLYVRATGTAQFVVRAFNEEGKLLQATTHQPSPPTPFNLDIPKKSPERPISIPFRHKVSGIQIQIECITEGTLKVLDFAVEVII